MLGWFNKSSTAVAKSSRDDEVESLRLRTQKYLALGSEAEAELGALRNRAEVFIFRETGQGEVETRIKEVTAEQALRQIKAEILLDQVTVMRQELEFKRALQIVASSVGFDPADFAILLKTVKTQMRSVFGLGAAPQEDFASSFASERDGAEHSERRR